MWCSCNGPAAPETQDSEGIAPEMRNLESSISQGVAADQKDESATGCNISVPEDGSGKQKYYRVFFYTTSMQQETVDGHAVNKMAEGRVAGTVSKLDVSGRFLTVITPSSLFCFVSDSKLCYVHVDIRTDHGGD